MDSSDRILFYELGGPYGEFSNFYASAFKIGDKEWPTAEHYFQAMKFEGSFFQILIHYRH